MSVDVLILGNPNSGKSLLFNRLTGLKQKVANFPGVTVEIRSAVADGIRFHDFPGVYSLEALTPDERVAVDGFRSAIKDPETRLVLCVLDATRLERSLYLLLQILPLARAARCQVIAVVNVIDELLLHASKVDTQALSQELGCPVIGISAKRGTGLDELKSQIASIVKDSPAKLDAASDAAAAFEEIETSKLRSDLHTNLHANKDRARYLAEKFGPQSDVLLKSQNRLDSFFLSSTGGMLVFFLMMLVLFQAIFSWASPLMDGTEALVEWVGNHVAPLATHEWAQDFLKDAVFGGMGSFLVFVPQIFVLFVIIGLLEDSGYLSRAAVILHRPLSFFGLSGRSFVPLLSGHACAIPAIMATRTIESPRKRLLTILATPFMSCSARLPVYGLLISGFVPATTILGGLIGLRGLAFFLLFVLGIVVALIVIGLVDRFTRKSGRLADAPFVVELPPYRLPGLKPILVNALSRAWAFVKNAGFMIFCVTVVVWVLGYFPKGAGHLDESWLGWVGQKIEPLFAPMGMDWKVGVGILTSFLAREVFVGTLGTLYGIEAAEDNMGSLSEKLQAAGMGLPTAAALLVFYCLSMQCVSTLAVMKKETGSWKIPLAVFVGMSVIAYVAAALTYMIFSYVNMS